MLLRCLTLWLTAVSLGTSIASAQPESPDEVIAKAIGNRLRIKSYDIEISSVSRAELVPHAPLSRYFLDGEKLRVDWKRQYHGSDRLPGQTETSFWYRRILTPTKSIRYDGKLTKSFEREGLYTDKDLLRIQRDYSEEKASFDLRSLGFYTAGAIYSCGIEDFLRVHALPEKTAVREALNGIDCVRLDFKLKSGVECRFWFAPGCGYAPVKARGHYPPLDSTDEIELTLREWKDSGIWFPSAYRASRRFGKNYYDDQSATLTVRSINEPLDRATFEAVGLRTGDRKMPPFLHDGLMYVFGGE